MKLKKLDLHGFAHDVVLVAFVAVFAIAGVGYLVASRAATPTLGKTWALPQQNETIAAYACKTVVSSSVWGVKGLFTLSNSYKNANDFAWTASIINGGSNPLKGYLSVYGIIPDTTSPATILKLNVSSQATANPLSFSYSAGTPTKGGTTVAGNIVQNFYPDKLPTCGS